MINKQTLLAGFVFNRLKIASMSDFVGSSIIEINLLFNIYCSMIKSINLKNEILFHLDHL
jgi:hypothetical protein